MTNAPAIPKTAVKPAQALQSLLQDPQTFLQENILSIAGGSTDKITDMFIGYHLSPATGQGAPKGTYKIALSSASLVPTDVYQYKAHNVHMVGKDDNTYNKADLQGYALGPSTPNDPNLMITGQLSGCSFVVLDLGQARNVLVTHIQPNSKTARGDAAALKPDLATNGHFHGHATTAVTKVFGGDGQDYDPRTQYAYVVGVRKNNKWEIYGQVTAGTSNQAMRIVKVVKIL
jgi:hypothetical protein